jgi:hypothetical protein
VHQCGAAQPLWRWCAGSVPACEPLQLPPPSSLFPISCAAITFNIAGGLTMQEIACLAQNKEAGCSVLTLWQVRGPHRRACGQAPWAAMRPSESSLHPHTGRG